MTCQAKIDGPVTEATVLLADPHMLLVAFDTGVMEQWDLSDGGIYRLLPDTGRCVSVAADGQPCAGLRGHVDVHSSLDGSAVWP